MALVAGHSEFTSDPRYCSSAFAAMSRHQRFQLCQHSAAQLQSETRIVDNRPMIRFALLAIVLPCNAACSVLAEPSKTLLLSGLRTRTALSRSTPTANPSCAVNAAQGGSARAERHPSRF